MFEATVSNRWNFIGVSSVTLNEFEKPSRYRNLEPEIEHRKFSGKGFS